MTEHEYRAAECPGDPVALLTEVSALFIRLMTLGCFFTMALAQTSTFWVPQYAEGSVGGVRISTDITLVNLGTGILNPARADVSAFDEAGEPADLLLQKMISGDTAVSSLQVEIPGRGTSVVHSASNNPSQVSEGWVRIDTEDNLAVEVIFSIFDATTGDLITTTSVLPGSPVTAGTVIVNVDTLGGLASALAVLNPPDNQDPATIDIVVYDQFGIEVGQAQVAGIKPGEKTAENWPELVSALQGKNGFIGSAEMTSNVPVAALGLRQDQIQLTTQDILTAR